MISEPALSPLDGRYRTQTAPLTEVFSEQNLALQRIKVEYGWLLHLSEQEDPAFETLHRSRSRLTALAAEVEACTSTDASFLSLFAEIKAIEAQTRHDVKAVEYWLQQQMVSHGIPDCIPWIHFACTSEDINSTAWASMLQTGLAEVLLPELRQLLDQLTTLAEQTASISMLARTHGQVASPTTFGKEVAVFANRLHQQILHLSQLNPSAKFSGATGNYNAHLSAIPHLPWDRICADFVEQRLQLDYNDCTTQIEPNDRLAEICHCLMRINRILTDMSRDFWGYIAMDYLSQKNLSGEIGSSTMPHKINPIDFENAEGNLQIADSLLHSLAFNLTVSRWQRDLSGSTLQRNIGTAAGHCLLAWKSLGRGLARTACNRAKITQDLESHWEVLTEAVQTALRMAGQDTAYEQLQQWSKGKGTMGAKAFQDAIATLPLTDETVRQRLLNLTPETYTGAASQIALKICARLKATGTY
ncbi:MAG: adenylosuccinate lyase [Gammaproteobacteria bacterium]